MARSGPVVAAPRFQVQTDVTMDAALEFREHPLANGVYRDGHFEQ